MMLYLNSSRWLRWITAITVCAYGIAYDQVEIPRNIFIVLAYILGGICIALLFRERSTNYIYLVIPVCNLTISITWAVLFGTDIRLELLTFISVCEVLLLSRQSKIRVYEIFRTFIVITGALGIICYLSILFDLGLPYTYVPFYSGNGTQWYLNFHVSYIYFHSALLTPRLCGLFNEPGYFGTIAAFILMIEDVNLKRLGNVVILCAGLLTLSFAFCILVILYLLIRHFYFKYILGLCITLCSIIYVVNIVDTENGPASRLIERFKIEDGKIKGNNRVTEDFDRVFNETLGNAEIIFGKGPNALIKNNISEGNAGFKVYILQYGILGFAFLWGTIICLSLKYAKFNRESLIFIALFFLSTYQRSTICTPDYILLLFGGIDYIRSRYVTKNENYVKKYIPITLP